MARAAASPRPPAEILSAILEEQISCCRSILEATEAVEAALDPLDLDTLDGAVAHRARALVRLSELEAEARRLRGALFASPPDLAPRLADLRDLARRVRRADERTREAAAQAMGRLKHRIRGVNQGQRGLRGYRGPVDPLPRFADRRG